MKQASQAAFMLLVVASAIFAIASKPKTPVTKPVEPPHTITATTPGPIADLPAQAGPDATVTEGEAVAVVHQLTPTAEPPACATCAAPARTVANSYQRQPVIRYQRRGLFNGRFRR